MGKIKQIMDKNQYLLDVLESHKMSKIESRVDKFKEKRDDIKGTLEEHYGSDMYSVFNSGSFAKHTATNVKFDMDIVAPFKHETFDTLENMFTDVYDFLKEKYTDAEEVRKQKVSVGITFPEDTDGDQVQIYVVPGRELSDDDYKKSHDLNLYFNEDHWGFTKGSRMKTNIQAQIDHIKGKQSERQVIRLLKIWKKQNNKPYKSFMLELFVIKGLNGYSGSNDLWERLKTAMQYISDNVTKDGFKLVDPGNSNNDVLSSMNEIDKSNLSSDMDAIIARVEDDDENLKIYFKENPEFKKEEKEGFGTNEVSYPPTGKRFG